MSETASETLRARRTQEERRSSTRASLLEATIACLVELGARGTTTLEVERRAGVSRGARIHHFPNKAALLASAVDFLYDRVSSQYAAAFGGSDPGSSNDRQRLCGGLHRLWSIYQHPQYVAALELTAAARTDAELKLALQPVAERHRRLALQAAAEFFPSIPPERASILVETIHAAFVGLHTMHGVTTTPRTEALVLDALESLVALHLRTDPERAKD